MRMLDDATQQALLRQAKMLMSPALERNLSLRSDRQTRDVEPRLSLKPLASPSPSLSIHASERSRRLNLQNSTLSSRDGRHVHGHRHAVEEPLLARLVSNRSSRTAMPPRHHPSREQRHSGFSPHRLSVAAMSQRGTVTGSTRHDDRRDRPRRSSGRGDLSSLERSSRRRSVSRELSQGRVRLHGRTTARDVGEEGSSSTRRFGRLGSGLSVTMRSRRGSERSGRGVATRRHSSSSNGVVTIHSRIRPNRELMERCLRRGEEEECTPRRPREDGAVFSVGWSSRQRQTLKQIDSGSRYNSSSPSGAASSFPSTNPTVPASSASASYSSSPVSRRPAYASEVSGSLRSRRRRERQERREGRLRRLKNKIATVFHHRHDHHHHHHFGRGKEDPSRRDRRSHQRMSPWRYLGEVFHSTKGQEKKTTSRTVASVPGERRGGGHMPALFDAMVRHLRGTRRKAPAHARMRRTGSRVQVKKLHWWQRLRRRRSRPRRRLGHGKPV
ncbi:uncharacterized protein LOC133889381 [Phragmites australis]|uniref:uncharacterized protein LOC133889381 n=1 Tax=Phragmites australis TaxID=29695 RepID=UPI002D79E173|nr:uncharacterized protein LOC133889381 [Phragmites australis]